MSGKAVSNRLLWVDQTKGIAIITVSICHICDVFFETKTPLQKWGYSWELFAFFFLGGMLFRIKERYRLSLPDYLIRQAKGIIYPYFTLSAFSIVFINRGHGIKNTLLFIGLGAMWFLPVYFISSVLSFLISKYIKEYKAKLIATVGIIVLTICFSTIIIHDYYDEVWKREGVMAIALVNRCLIAISIFMLGFFSGSPNAIKKFEAIRNPFIACAFLIGGVLVWRI